MDTAQIAELLIAAGLEARLVYAGPQAHCPGCSAPDTRIMPAAA